jgi:hypothetical protein
VACLKKAMARITGNWKIAQIVQLLGLYVHGNGTLMGHSNHRRFTLSDVLIIVAWAAIAFWFTRVLIDVVLTVWPNRFRTPWRTWTSASYMVLLWMNICVLNLRLMAPRPPWRRLARQPGFVAGIAVAASIFFKTVSSLASWLAQPSLNDPITRLNNYLISICFPGNIAPFVILAWIILFVQGIRRSRTDWIESAARLLGCASILGWLVSFIVMGL